MNTMDNNIIKGKLKLLLKDIDYRTLIIALEYNRIAYKEIANNHKDYFNKIFKEFHNVHAEIIEFDFDKDIPIKEVSEYGLEDCIKENYNFYFYYLNEVLEYDFLELAHWHVDILIEFIRHSTHIIRHYRDILSNHTSGSGFDNFRDKVNSLYVVYRIIKEEILRK